MRFISRIPAFVALALAAPLHAQGYIYRDIAWGSDAETTTAALAQEGFTLNDFSPAEGELMYTDPENRGVLAFASFAGERLVGIRIVSSGDNVDQLFEQSVADWMASFGEPQEVEAGRVTWRSEGTTSRSCWARRSRGTATWPRSTPAPGTRKRSSAGWQAATRAGRSPRWGEQWAVALVRPGIRTTVDRGRVEALGDRAFRVWLREDFLEVQTDPVRHDMQLHRMEYDCAGGRFRVFTGSWELQGREVQTRTAEGGSRWRSMPAGSVGELIMTAVCRIAEQR